MTRFADAKATRQWRETVTLRQFAERIRETRAPSKGALPWMKLATFGDAATDKGALRHDDNLITVDGVEGDYDAGKVSVAEAVERLRSADVGAVIYTTPSHTAAAPRWRVLAPTSAPMSPDERRALCERLNGALGGILAKESFTRSQAYYFGAVGAAPDHAVEVVDGRAIDHADDIPRTGRSESRPDPVADEDDDDLWSLIEPNWPRIRGALAVIPSEDRDDWLTVGMAIHAESRGSDDGFAVWSEWSKASDKFNARDQRRTWKSFSDQGARRVGIGTMFELAKRFGWEAKSPAAAKPSRLTFLTPSECESSPSRGYVVKGILAPGDIGCIFGAPGAGKSLIAPHIGYATAQGREAFGMRTKPGLVFYVAAEDPHGMRGRVTALKIRHDDAPGFTLIEGVSDLLSDDSPDLKALQSAVQDRKPALVFIDTLAMSFPGLEENDANAMGRVVAVARSLAQWGAAVVLIHHDTKAEGKTPRGHSLLNGALDMAMHVSRDDQGIVRGALTKNRNGTCERDIAFTIATETLGFDEDNDAITAALVAELTGGLAAKPPKVTPEKAALQLLERLADSNGLGPDWVDVSAWREACANSLAVSAAETLDSRKRIIRRLIERLTAQGRIETDGDRVRPAVISPEMTDAD
ncbi:MAG: AAA family ATPase [Brevundimonas sp.]|uniref:AAA family ATPase n=1 Tax=Brevundimonas sp. TaxID=1871086 RepID=UPI0025BB6D13|nr:AAA family ATPase [Brevundimonas sp.]MBX3476692.1 AAA family ATPase [Brevundimonas sp.]